MRVSAKGRYALAAMAAMAEKYGNGEFITIVSISDRFAISKIYLEQVFSLLKRGKLVISVKGAQGGYQLSRSPAFITAYDVLHAVESSLFEKPEGTVKDRYPELEEAMRSLAFEKLDASIKEALSSVTIESLCQEACARRGQNSPMFYI